MLLLEAIRAGAAFVDVEVDAPAGYREEVMGCAKSGGCAIIVSFHDHAKTPVRGRETADGQIDHGTLRTALRALAPDGRGAGER
jgi:3-dehydroquinate dehydratase